MPNENDTPQPGEVFLPPGPLMADSGETGRTFGRALTGAFRLAWSVALGQGFDRDAAQDIGSVTQMDLLHTAIARPSLFRRARPIDALVIRIARARIIDACRRTEAIERGNELYGPALQGMQQENRDGQEEGRDGEQDAPDLQLACHAGWLSESTEAVADRVAEVLRAEIVKLPAEEQTAWRLAREENMTAREAAGVMGISMHTHKKYLGRATKALLNALKVKGLLAEGARLPNLLAAAKLARPSLTGWANGSAIGHENGREKVPARLLTNTPANKPVNKPLNDPTRENR